MFQLWCTSSDATVRIWMIWLFIWSSLSYVFCFSKSFSGGFQFFYNDFVFMCEGVAGGTGRRIYLMVWNMLRPCGRISFRWKSYWFRCCRALRREENGNSRVSDFCKACQQEQHSKYRFSVLQWSAGRFVKQITCSVCMALRLGTYLENCICHLLQ